MYYYNTIKYMYNTSGTVEQLVQIALHCYNITKLNISDRVVFGSTVQLENIETGESVTYKIVGEDEADIKCGLVSYSSPVARAIIGRVIDETVVVKAPRGETEYEIIDVQYV